MTKYQQLDLRRYNNAVVCIRVSAQYPLINEELEQFLQIGELLNDRHLPCRDPGSRQCADSDRSGELLSDSLHAGRGQQRDFAVYSRCLCHIGGH